MSDPNETQLSLHELNALVRSFRVHARKIELSVFRAFFDVFYDRKDTYEWVLQRRYAFHYSTGWLLQFIPNFREMLIIYNTKCKRLYYKPPISLWAKRSKPETLASNYTTWLKKAGYRFILCLRRKNPKKTILLSIVRHVSVPVANATSTSSKYALTKAKIIARAQNREYPHIYKMDRMLIYYVLRDDIKYLRLLKQLIKEKRLVYKP